MKKITIKLDASGQGRIMLGKMDISKYVVGGSFNFYNDCGPLLNINLAAENFEIISELHESEIVVDEIKIFNPEIKIDGKKNEI